MESENFLYYIFFFLFWRIAGRMGWRWVGVGVGGWGGCSLWYQMDIRTSRVAESHLKVNFCDLTLSEREQRKSFVPSWALTLPCSAVCLSPEVFYYKWRLAESRRFDGRLRRDWPDSQTVWPEQQGQAHCDVPLCFLLPINFVGSIGIPGASLLFCWQTHHPYLRSSRPDV